MSNSRVTLSGDARVTILLLRGIGDVIWGLAAVRALKRACADCRVSWIVHPGAAPLIAGHPDLEEVIPYDPRGGLAHGREVWRTLRRHPADILLNYAIYLHGLLPLLATPARRRIGFGKDRARDGIWIFNRERLPPRPRRHLQDEYLEFVEYLGAPVQPVEWRLPLTDEESEASARLAGAMGDGPRIALIPTAGRPEKDWPMERWAQLSDRLGRDLQATVLLAGGPAALEQRRAQAIEGLTRTPVRNELGASLRRLLVVLRACDLVIAPDTGPIHVARALGIPVVGLYGHTDPLRYGPYGDAPDHLVDRYHFEADGTPTRGEVSGGRSGRMELISVEDVMQCVRRVRSAPATTADQG